MKKQLNQNNTLLVMTGLKDYSFRLFETYNFREVADKEDEYQQFIGRLKFLVPFYESHVIFLVGDKENLNFPPTHISVWDDRRKRKSAALIFNQEIADLKARKEGLFALVASKILVFSVKKDFQLLCSLDAVSPTRPFEISYSCNPIIAAYQSNISPSQVKVTKLRLDSLDEINGRLHYVVTTLFTAIQRFYLSRKVRCLI